ncbi:MAG: NAD(P)/FAD-dependent oxidoreductase [Dehalococcoidia bacterium]
MLEVELLIIGAGPAGTAAALTAREFGIETLLVDESPLDPANLQRNIPKWYGSRDAARQVSASTVYHWLESRADLQQAIEAGAEVLTQHAAWGTFPNRVVGIFDGTRTWLVQARQIILASGSTDLHLAFPGWTLGGVLGGGAALQLLDTYGYLNGKRMLILGSGDLGLTVAERAIQAGLEVVGIVEIEPRIQGNPILARELEQAGVCFFLGQTIKEAEGGGELERVRLLTVSGEPPTVTPGPEIEVDTLCVAIGRQPAIELAYLSGCAMAYDRLRGGFYPRHDQQMRTSQEGILVAGDLAGARDATFRSPDHAERSGRTAASSVAEALGRVDGDRARHDLEDRSIAAQPTSDGDLPRGAQSFASAWHAVAEALAGDDLIICRCEEVTRGEVLAAEEFTGGDHPDEVKRVSRAGMGLCQGRGCRPLIAGLLASRSGRAFSELPIASYRPPLRPLPLGALATEEKRAVPQLAQFLELEARLRHDVQAGILQPQALTRYHWRVDTLAYRWAEQGKSDEELRGIVEDLERQIRYTAKWR